MNATPRPSERGGPARSLLLVALGALAGAALGAALRPSPAAPSPATCPSASATSATVAPSQAPLAGGAPAGSTAPSASPSAERAASGDLDALKHMELQDEATRSIEDALAIARGHAALARGDVEALVSAIERDPALAQDRATLARLHDLVEREAIPLDALAALARVPGAASVDLLHALWRRHRATTTGLLARDLVRRQDALARASPALRTAIDLEALLEERPSRESQAKRRCEKVRALLERVATTGDRRCGPSLDELAQTGGCGPDGAADCFPCLREGDELKAAREATRKREPPAPWVLAR